MAIHFYQINEAYGCFSNFSKHPILIEGVQWPTSEHYFQAMKFPTEPDRQERIRQDSSPSKAKKIAWEPSSKMRPDWDTYRDEVMLKVIREKFQQHPNLKKILLSTEKEILVEHTKKDSYWGDGGDGSGKNKLGQTLMQVREELRKTLS
ncbi:MAG: NADAR family protein [Planctomycetota bacterium]